MIWFGLFVAAWLACGVVAGMLYFAWFQKEYPSLSERFRKEDRLTSFAFTMLGPTSLIGMLSFLFHQETKFKHGLKRFW